MATASRRLGKRFIGTKLNSGTAQKTTQTTRAVRRAVFGPLP
jgi:hypothetical protein